MHRAIADVAGHRAIAAAMQFADHSEVELERLQSERQLEKKRAERRPDVSSPSPSSASNRRGRSATRTIASDRRTARRPGDRSRAGSPARGNRAPAARSVRPFRSSARSRISRARGTRPRMSGMLRQPSQSSTTSRSDDGDLGVDERDRLRSGSRVSSSSTIERGDENAEPFVDLRRGQPDAVVLDHRVDHVVDQLLNRRALRVSAFSSGRAFARSTG